MLSIATMGVRGFQVLFAIIVIGLGSTLAKQQTYGSVPATTGYTSFTGGLGIIVGFVGLASLWFTAIPSLVVLGLDAVTALLFAAGGIAWAVGLKGISCTDRDSPDNRKSLYANSLLNEGCIPLNDGTPYCGVLSNSNDDQVKALDLLIGNCQKGLTTEIFSFLSFLLLAILLGLGYVLMRKGGISRRTVVA